MDDEELFAITAATAALVAAAAAAPAHAEEPGTIVDIAVAASGGGTPDDNPGDYDLLVQAVLSTGLEGALADPRLVKAGTDIVASNGVIHTIDRVLIPGDL